MARQATVVTLKELCKKTKVQPRIARRRLREAGNKVPQGLKGHRWAWPKSKVPGVIPYISD